MSRETVSKITDQVLEEMSAWMNRPLIILHGHPEPALVVCCILA